MGTNEQVGQFRHDAETDSPDLSVTIVAYNSDDTLSECLEALEIAMKHVRAEALVVDNASPDGSAALVKAEYPAIKVLSAPRNLLFAGGCNYALPHVRGRYWMLLNPDAIVSESALRALVDFMDQNPELGIGSPELSASVGAPQNAARRDWTLGRVALESTRLHKFLPQRIRDNYLLCPYWQGGSHLDVDWVPGTAMIIRMSAVQAAGPLSEDVLMYGEDSEFCRRVRRHGWRVGVCADVSVGHVEGQSTLRTWGREERGVRLWNGILDSVRIARGWPYAELLRLAYWIAYALESRNPRRTSEHRSESRFQQKSIARSTVRRGKRQS